MSPDRSAFLRDLFVKRPAAVAVIAAIVAALFAAGYLARRERKILALAAPAKVVVAAHDIAPGEALDEGSLALAEVPSRFVQPGAIERLSDAAGRVAMVPIRVGSHVTHSTARMHFDERGIASLIPSGMRALSISLPRSRAAAGLVRPGDFVDIIVTFDLGSDASSRRTTLTVAGGVRLLAVDRRIAGAPEVRAAGRSQGGILSRTMGGGPRSGEVDVTLEVSLKQAQVLAFAQESGVLALALRPFGEGEAEEVSAPTTIATVAEGASGFVPMRREYREYRGRR